MRCSSFFCYMAVSILPKNQDKLLNLWLKQLSRRQSCTSKLASNNNLEEIWDAIWTISNIKWGVMGTKIRENAPCVTWIWYKYITGDCLLSVYVQLRVTWISQSSWPRLLTSAYQKNGQVLTCYSEKSVSNQKVHLWLIKSNVTKMLHLKIALKEIPVTSLVLHLGKWDFHCLQ